MPGRPTRSRRQMMRSLATGALALLAAPGATAPPTRRNLLFIMSDQHHHGAIGCAGDPLAITPNLDALAKAGTRFATAYCQAPVCVPARMSVITGRYAHAHGALTNAYALPSSERTIGHHLADHGYLTAAIGKMHFIDDDNQHGFQVRLDHADFNQTISEDARAWHRRSSDSPWRRGTGGPAPIAEDEFIESFVARQTIRFLEEHRDGPFCLWCSFVAPHPPFWPPADYYAMYPLERIQFPEQAPPEARPLIPELARRQQEWANTPEDQLKAMIAGYYGLVTMVDTRIGEVLAAVDRLGLRDRTVISYTADHGELKYEHRLFLKFNFFEGASRVPMILSFPPEIPRGRTRRQVVEHVDMYPTFCDLLGVPTPATVQGQSLLPLARGRARDWPNRAFSEQGRNMRMIRDGRWKLNLYSGEPLELYNLERDPNEFYNLIDRRQLRPVVERLRDRCAEWLANTPPDRTGTAKPYERSKA